MVLGKRWQQGLIAGCVIAALLLLVWSNNLFTRTRLLLSDVYFVPADTSGTIVIVAVDDASLNRYGRTPAEWSRTVYIDLITTLNHAGARVVAFDLLFSEATSEDDSLVEVIRAARQGDNRLRTVLASAGVHPASAAQDLEGFPQAIRFENSMTPARQFADTADYLGYVNTFPDVDGVVRRQPSLIQIGDQARLSWSLAVYLAYLRIPASAMTQVITSDDGSLRIAPNRVLYIDDLGFWPSNYYGPPFNLHRQTFPVVSFLDVVGGTVDPAIFDDKIVLVGLINSTGITDKYTVPSAPKGQLMSGVEIQANAIETLLQNHPLRSPGRLPTAASILILSIGSTLIYLRLRWYMRFLVWLVLGAVGLGISIVLFSSGGWLINLFDTGLALTLPVIVTIGLDITYEINLRRQSEFLLRSVVKVSQQRLVLDKVLPHIVTDIHRIVPSAAVLIWRADRGQIDPQEIYRSIEGGSPVDPELYQLAYWAAQRGSMIVNHSKAALPVAWQHRVIAVYAIHNTDNTALPRRSLSLLQRLSEQLAPGLENTFLYTEVERQKAVQDAILAGSPAGILVLDQNHQLRRCNQAFETTFNLTGDAFRGQPVPVLLEAVGIAEKSRTDISHSLRENKPFRCEIVLGERTFNLDAAVQPEFKLWVLVLTEITHLIQLSQLKTYMIRMLSHDLGNPLARVLGYSQLLLQGDMELSPTQHEFVDYIIQDGELMDRIIRDVLNLEQLRSGELEAEKVDLCQMVLAVADQHDLDLTMKHQALTSTVPDTPVYVNGNKLQLSLAIANLLSNAIKYTPDNGQIHIHLTLVETHRVRLSVSDTGYGIPQAAQARIFTEFYRAKTRQTIDVKGTGLGLSLVKVVIEKHAGRVWFESEEGKGSTFFIELPVSEEGSER